jgi:predicted esterase
MIIRTIAATTHGRYLVVPPTQSESPAGLLVGFHGYAEPAAAALERLQTIPDAGHWRLMAIQGLNRFYRGRSTDVVASWMTREDRELAIADNVSYVAAVIEAASREWVIDGRLVFAGFSQGVAMAYRAAAAAARTLSGVIALGGDVPPDLDRAALARIPATLIGRGSRDDWYTDQKFGADVARLRDAGVAVTVVTLDAGHEWTEAFSRAAADFLTNVRR